ncbi:DUF3574 domain-containing protein [Pelagibius sp.]|uniref:DUF3574 domain-containing protein n=1 Tax=Pelagibius sp. TaxID=1931238 RepID=UPI00260D48C1|nr:DUF3574 domain-containing protein [Pelagibius sp.]
MSLPRLFTFAFLPAVFLAVTLVVAPTPSGAQVAMPACQTDYLSMARLELYFGTTKKDGSTVSDAAWSNFLDEEVTPRFPDGLTVLRGYGQWRNSQGVIAKEGSIVLVILYFPSEESESKIEDIRAAYKDRFDQESVMRVDSANCVSF